MKHATSIFILSLLLIVSGCGGGSSDSGGSSDGGTIPKSLVGTYTGTFDGRGTNANGPFTCSGSFQMTISQSGGNLVVRVNVDPIVVTPCDGAFNVTATGTYNPTNGVVSFGNTSGSTTVSVSGNATEKEGQITLSGAWSITETSSSTVIASGTWMANKQ